MDDERDASLVLAARAGDKAAFATLLARHRPLLVALCRRALPDSQEVEDVVQEAALQALINLDRLRRPERFGSWLAGIGLNLARRSRRRSRADWSWEAMLGGQFGPREPVDPGPGLIELTEAADLASRVRAAVFGLPEGQRRAVLLVYLGGMTHAEAAAVLGIEAGAVKTRLHKARRTLRRTLRATWRETTMTTTTEPTMIEAAIIDVRRAPVGEGRPPHLVVILQEAAGQRCLPIWLGEFEGTAIALHLEQVAAPRPMTYAFAASVLAAAGGSLREVRIDRLQGDVFFAVAAVGGPGGEVEVDARPSDALNLALLAGAPIKIARALFEQIDHAAAPERMLGADLDAADVAGAAQIAAGALASWESAVAAAGDAEAGVPAAATEKAAVASST